MAIDSAKCAVLVLLILFSMSLALRSQSLPTRILEVSEPSELTGQPKEIKQPTPADLELFEVIGDLGDFTDKAKMASGMAALNKFILEHPDYSDAYFLRAYSKVCVLNSRAFTSIVQDITNAMAQSGARIYHSTDYYSLLAKIELENGQFTRAIGDLEKAMTRDVSDANKMFNIEGTSPETTSKFCIWNLADLDSLAARFPKDYRVWLFEGLYYEFFTTFNERYYPKALAEFQKAAELNPKSALPRYFIGQVHTKAAFWTKAAWASDADRDKETSNAAQAYSQAISLNPDYLPAYQERASAYLNLKQYASAIKDYDKILALDPDNTEAFSDRGVSQMESGHYFSAKTDFTDSIERIERKHEDNSFLSNLYEYRGDVNVKIGLYREAISDYSKAIELHLQSETILLSLKQFRALYPEYDKVRDAELLQKLHARFAPQMNYDEFSKQLLEENGKWEVSFLLSNVYEKRGDAYLLIGDYRRGALDFQRIYNGVPQMGASTDRWRPLGKDSSGNDYYLDVKTAEFPGTGFPELWTKLVSKRNTQVIEDRVDCKARRLNTARILTYDSSGNVLNSSNASSGWEEVVPDTIGEQIVKGACSANP